MRPFSLPRAALLLTGLLSLSLPAGADSSGTAAAPVVSARITGTRLDGSGFDSRQLAGKSAVVLLWSPDSLASRKSLGEFGRFATLHPELTLVALATPPVEAEALARFAEARGLGFPIGVLGTNELGELPTARLPVVIHYDAANRLRVQRAGIFRLRDLEALVSPAAP